MHNVPSSPVMNEIFFCSVRGPGYDWLAKNHGMVYHETT